MFLDRAAEEQRSTLYTAVAPELRTYEPPHKSFKIIGTITYELKNYLATVVQETIYSSAWNHISNFGDEVGMEDKKIPGRSGLGLFTGTTYCKGR